MRGAEHWMKVVSVLAFALLASVAADKKPVVNESPDVVALTERAKKSVVVVTQFGRDGRQDGVGSGFVVSSDGLIATCLHVIGEGRPITVQLADGRKFDATEVHASDRKLDLALVRIAATNLPALRLGDSSALKQGASVIAMGNPVGLDHSVVQGVVSAKRDFDGVEMIQLAIPIEQGNSGGPLLDTRGRVQGLLNMKSAVTANLGFAVPVNALKTMIERPNPVPIERWLSLGALDPQEWQPVMGARWSRKTGRVLVEGAGAGFGGRSLCLWQQETPELPFELSVSVKLDDETGAAGLAFASDGGDRHYGFYPTAGQMRLTRFDGPDVFSWNILKEFKTPRYKPGEWNTIRVRVETNRIIGFVNGEQVMEVKETVARDGKVGLAKFRDTKAQFKNFSATKESLSGARVTTWPQVTNTAERSEADLISQWNGNGGAGHGALLEHARQLDKEASRLRRVAATVHARGVEAELLKALEGPEDKIDLFHAALLVAKLDNPELDLEAYRAELTRLARELKRQVPAGSADTNKIAALTKFLFTEQGFHGSRTDFYNRANSYMDQVMDDREGLPITLAVLWLELARQLGVTNVAGVPLPTRFMVRFAPRGGSEQIIDVFDGGKVLSRGDAVELVADNVERIDEEHFAPAKKRDIIARMLNNLLGLAQRDGNVGDMVRYLDAMIALKPESVPERLQRARVLMQRGENEAAKKDLRWLMDREPAGVDLERLGELYRSL
jgi:serine protease Do